MFNKKELEKNKHKDKKDKNNECKEIGRCQPKCEKLIEEDDIRYFKEGQLLEDSKCLGVGCRTKIDSQYLRYCKVFYCKKYSEECDVLFCVNCVPVTGRKRR